MTSEVLAQGGRWVRATHTEWCETYPDHTRPYHLEMPLLTESLAPLLDYPHRDELAFCIPLGLHAPPWIENRFHRFEGFCKAALLLARNIARYWDVAEQQVPIFIGVSANGRKIFEGYRQACDFPEEQIIALPSMEKYPVDFASGWNVKMDMLASEALKIYQRRIHLDASLYLKPGTNTPKLPVCESILVHWAHPEREGFALAREHFIEDTDSQSSVAAGEWLIGRPKNYWQRLGEIMKTSAQAERHYWLGDSFIHVPGYVFGISPAFLADARIAELWTQLQMFMTTDEGIMSCLVREWNPTPENTITQLGSRLRTSHWTQEDEPRLCYMEALSLDAHKTDVRLMEWWRHEQDYTPTRKIR